MAIDTNRLKNRAMRVRAVIDKIDTAYGKIENTGEAHLSDLEALHKDVSNMSDDLDAAINTVGNSGGVTQLRKP